MIGNISLKSILKHHPVAKEHFRFMAHARRALANRAIKKGKSKALVLHLSTAFEKFDEQEDAHAYLLSLLDRHFKKTPPDDALLHLCGDIIPYALLLYLKNSSDSQRAQRWHQSCMLFEGYLKIDQSALYKRYSSVNKVLEQRNFLSYAQSDKETRVAIRKQVYAYAKIHGIKESDAASMIDKQFLKQRRQQKMRIFTTLLLMVPLVLSALALVYCGPLPFLLLLLPIFTLSLELVFTIASLTVTPDPIFKLDVKQIEHPTLVVVTLLLTSQKELEEQARRLEIMHHQNPDAQIRFGILADFKDARRTEEPGDELLEREAVDIIERLNGKYPNRFCLFIRDRTPYPADGIYMGWERKRGALIELVRFIKGKPAGFRRILADKDFLSGCRYILTLDADTDLRMDAVRTLYAAMRHPQNHPVIEGGVVVKGYGVLQPRMVTAVPSAGRSPFALLHTGSGGLDSYQNALFDFYQSVYHKGAFCGKGMFDVDAFYRVIDGAFPDGRILSHDLLEGTRLRCGYLSELALTDSAPASALSFFSRQHRWTRGDLQALPFAGKHLPFAKQKNKNPIDSLSKFMIVSNVLRALTPVFSLAALFFSTHLKESTCTVFLLFSFSYLLFPLIMTTLRSVRFANRRFFSTVMQSLWQCVCHTLFSFCALAYTAQLSLDALLRVLYRSLVSKKKLLEWVTAGEGEKKYKNAAPFMLFLLYLKKALPSVIVGLIMMFFSVGGIVRLLGAGFALYPLVAFLLSRPYRPKENTSEAKRKRLLQYASDSFLYFERFVTEKDHFLPPDNYQELPVARLARRTSPTNIALYLSSCLAMADLKLRERDEMIGRIEDTVNTLLLLPKYRGHLYNWYDTATLELLGTPYISTVDSGNLAVALLSVKKGLEALPGTEALCKKIEGLLCDMDFSFLFKKQEGLLAIGFDPVEQKQSDNCYDLLLSESRSAYYFAIATRQIPKESWGKLSIPITAKDGHIGVFSWSGTAFEYFMPPLFLPLYENTLLFEALCFALYEQEKDRTEGLWGRSECCYFSFDGMMNYQYRAFGCGTLALDPAASAHNVIAPYATFLTLCLSPSLALRNLKRLEEMGAYGSCGFYEAIDFTPDRVGRGNAVIRSYMSHHVGMSITAVSNACLGNLFVERTMSDPQMKAAEELLYGRVPVDAPVSKNHQPSTEPLRLPLLLLPQNPKEHHHCENLLLTGGAFRMLVSDKRKRIAFSFEDLALTPPIHSDGPFPSLSLETERDSIDLLSSPLFYGGGRILIKKRKDKKSFDLSLSPLKEGGAIFQLEWEELPDDSKIVFRFPLAFCKEEAYFTHPAYPGLSVEAFADEKNQILFFKKRSASSSDRPLFLAFAANCPFSCAINEESDPCPFEMLAAKGILPCRRPSARIVFEPTNESGSAIDLAVLAGRSKKELIRRILLLKQGKDLPKKPWKSHRKEGTVPLPDKKTIAYASMLMEGVWQKRKTATDLPCYPINALWQFAISGDFPIFTFLLPEGELSDSQKKVVSALLRGHAFLALGGVHFDLIFLRKEREAYFAPSKNELLDLIKNSTGTSFIGKKGGVHLLFNEEAQRILPSFSTVFLFVEKDCIFPSLKKAFLSCLEEQDVTATAVMHSKPLILPDKNVRLSLPCGEFLQNGYAPKKSRKPFAPFSQMYCNSQFGTLVTDRSLGFSWFRNAGELRLTPFSGNEETDLTGEKLLILIGGRAYDTAGGAESAVFERGCARYEGCADVVDYTVFAGVDPKLPVKAVVIRLQNRSPLALTLSLSYRLTPCLHKYRDGMVCEKRVGDTTFYKRTVNRNSTDFGMYLSYNDRPLTLPPEKEVYALFLIGSVNLKNDRCFYYVKSRFQNEKDAFAAFDRYAREESDFSSCFDLQCDLPAFSLYLSEYLPLQVRKGRLFARTGFYQPGGAFGFRDQLQDALSLLYHNPQLLERQLYRCAAHQYYTGDVQHWWHPLTFDGKMTDAGVRTFCSDDLLWMVFATAFYLDHTSNTAILEKQISYLSSPSLKEGEERYERPERTDRKESFYHHLLRALDLVAQRRSDRGLCLMGSCDWNDGFSEIKGESVWLTQFFLLCLERFTPYFQNDDLKRYQNLKKELKEALEKHCFKDGRYLRAFFKSGEALGDKSSPYCQIDLLPQAFAVFLDPGDPKAKAAINNAHRLLFDEQRKIFKLFTPAYHSSPLFPGYLGGYCPGFRENGGQYTHAAAWGALALLFAGEYQKGFEVLRDMHPITHWQKQAPVYALEPYFMAGDVYSAKGFEGRGGWSLYTGSAGWYLIALLVGLLGYHEDRLGFSLSPRLSKEFSSFKLTVRKKETVYHLEVLYGQKQQILLDGMPHDNRFLFDKKEHNVKMVLQKNKK